MFNSMSFTISEHFVVALLYGDYTGLADEEEQGIDEFIGSLPRNGHWAVPESSSDLARCDVCGLISECNQMLFFYPKRYLDETE